MYDLKGAAVVDLMVVSQYIENMKQHKTLLN